MLKISSECLVVGDLNIDIILNELDRFPKIDIEVLSGNYDMLIGGSGGIFTAVLSMLGIRTAIISK
ncbi:MAG: carbohydrate kinase family protein, partial [Candidatus Humimicrobiaceae bacterium]